ncbi:MAG: DUF6364 family protein [Verrucomicrobiota bacterium]
MPAATLTVTLPAEDIEFLEGYARQHGLTVAEALGQTVRRLHTRVRPVIHPEVAAITGLVPPDLDAKAEYRQHLLDKHR